MTSLWTLGNPEKRTIKEKKNTVHSVNGSYGPMQITIEAPTAEQLKWTSRAIHCTGGYVCIHYTVGSDFETVTFNLDPNQIFSIQQGQVFFQITTNGRNEPFLFLKEGTFIPEINRLKQRVTLDA